MAADFIAGNELGEVQQTGVGVALKRAIEAARALPLLHDPVVGALVKTSSSEAAALAQQELERLVACAAAASSAGDAAASTNDEDKQAVVTLALRCRYIDDEILCLLHAIRKKLAAAGKAGGSPSGSRTARKPIQVVMLGAGLDTRPWRLPLGHDIRWLELDMPDSVAFKAACMARTGMASSARSGTFSSAGDQDLASSASPAFPLHVGSWAAVGADLAVPGWQEALEGAGWDPAAPTVWVAEGVHYYLNQVDADRLVEVAAAASKAAGLGALVLSLCTPAMVVGINSVKKAWAAGADGLPGEWWCQASFPDYQATLGDDPCEELLEAGWEATSVLSLADLESLYASARSTRVLPAAAAQAAGVRFGGVDPEYQIATATLGL